MKKQWMLLVAALTFFVTCSIAQTTQQQPGPEQGGPAASSPNTNPGATIPPDGSNSPSAQAPSDSSAAGKESGTAMPNSDTAASGSAQPKMSDSDLQSAVRSKLSSDPAFANVQATVENGKVTLDGSVNSKEDKKRVKEQVKSVAGVKKVKEHLSLNAAENQAKPTASGTGPGMAMLGDQDSPQSSAGSDQNTAGSTAGNSQTSANPSSQAPSATTPEAGSMGSGQTGTSPSQGDTTAMPQSDNSASSTSAGDTMTLKRQIESAIKNDPSLTQSTVNVNVTDEAIDLQGTVANEDAKTNAERIAQSYAVNRKVNNHLQVTGRGNSDLQQGNSSMSNSSTTSDDNSTGGGATTYNTGNKSAGNDTGAGGYRPERESEPKATNPDNQH